MLAFLLAADGKMPDGYTQGAAAGLLTKVFDLSESEGFSTLGKACVDIGEMGQGEQEMLLASCLARLKASQSPEGLQSLFNQLEIIANGGLSKDGKLRLRAPTGGRARFLAIVQDSWGVQTGVVEQALGRSAVASGSSGCLLFIGLGFGFASYLLLG